MKSPFLVLILTCATWAAAAESPPTGKATAPPRYSFKPLIEDYYPSVSRYRKEQGTTKLGLCYDEQGKFTRMKVAESSGFARLDEAALRWGGAVRIKSGLFGGRPLPGCVSIPVKFSFEQVQDPKDQGEPILVEPPLSINIPPPAPPYRGRFIPLGSDAE
jgi:TonB family protein